MRHIGAARDLIGMDRDRRIDKDLPLRRVEFHILLSLAVGERHGYGIIQDIEARGETSVPDVGTIYRALARMVEAGLIEAAARRTAPDTGDERRNYYRITNAGMRVARSEAQRLGALVRAARLGGLLPKGVK
jgi:DNA-binding PadR family transcriptional regulator